MKRSLMKVLAVIKKPLNPVLHSEYIADIKKLLFAQTVEEAGYDKQVSKDLRKAIWPSVQFGLGTLLFGFLFFIVWGGLAPLDQAAIANGRIVLSGNHKTIQYKEGGVIREIYIQDGSRVKKDQILIELNDTDEKASVQVLGNQLLINLAIEQRIRAEQDPDPAAPLNFDQSLFDSKNPEIECQKVSNKWEIRHIEGKTGTIPRSDQWVSNTARIYSFPD
jgi:multidrug resistance efflux pump